MGTMLFALGRFCGRRPLAIMAAWALLAVGIIGAVRIFGAETSSDLDLPGTGSQEVHDLLEKRFPPQQNGTNPIVFYVATGKLTDKANAAAVKSSVSALRNAPHVDSVTNPVSDDGQTAGLLSKDARTAFAPVLLDIGSGDLEEGTAQRIFDATEPAADAGIEVAAAGSIGTDLSKQSTESSELVGILAAMFILTLVLGSLVAMGLPIIAAVLGLAVALSTVGLLGHLVSMPDTGATLATMIGLGVGIDYALFLISRHQEQLAAGVPIGESIARSVATSGSAIVFAGGTVVVALVSLRVAGIPLLSTLGLASAMAVVTAVLAAITLLPALLGLLGHRIGWLHLPTFGKRGAHAGGMWRTWSRFLSRHPLAVTLVSLAVLVPLIVPALSLRFGQEDIGATARSTTERQAYDLITAGFGVGYNGPLQVASQFDPTVSPSQEYTDKYNKATSLQQDLEQKQKQLPKEQQRLESKQRQLEAQQDQLESQQQALESQQGRLEASEQQLLAEEGNLEQQEAELQAAGASLQRRADQLAAREASLRQQQRQLEAEQARLQKERAQLERQARALAAEIRPLAQELARTLVRERLLEERIESLDGHPELQAILQQRLDALRAREQELRTALAPLERQATVLATRARSLARQAAVLQRQADQLQGQADQVRAQAATLENQKASLERQAAAIRGQGATLQADGTQLQGQAAVLQEQGTQLQQQGSSLQQQGAQLQNQADDLKAEQKQAQQEQKQAEQLKTELTNMMTAAGGDDRNTDPRVVRLQNALAGTPGMASLTPPQTNKSGDVVLLSAVPASGPATVKTADLLGTVRDQVLPGVEDRGGIRSYVGGYTASYVDLATLISQRLLLVIGTVILLGFLLLMLAFRSLLVPLQAAVTNLLSAAAAFGVLTAAFQWGWGITLLGIDTASSGVPIASYVPLMMFAVLFGLSMDYEVFLVSHVQLHHAAGEPARRAAASGLMTSARITTAACLIMTSVFASFILDGDPTIKQFGVGLAGAVLLAGLLVVTLAPATIMLMGEAAWWLPRWLDQLLPHMHLEGEQPPGSAAAPPAPSAEPAPGMPEQRRPDGQPREPAATVPPPSRGGAP
jgi:uncharacterized membrane protein YdfJ with MMPL/SSD domain